ncbi:MAG: PorV/PorQ family protein [Atribacterota bacterium]
MNIKNLVLIIVLLFITKNINAGEPGSASCTFLKLPVGARAAAMGGAVVGLSNDVYSTFWNPAGLKGIDGPQFGLMYNASFENIYNQYIAYAHPFKIGRIGIGIKYLGAGKIQGYDAYGIETSNVEYYDLAGSISYQRNLSDFLSGGVTLKYITERLDTKNASTVGMDLGFLYETKNMPFVIGGSMNNLGPKIKFIEEKYPIPLLFDLGVGYIDEFLGKEFLLELDGVLPSDNDLFIRTGMEINIEDLILLRLGYNNGYSSGNGLNAGFGLGLDGVNLDYAYRGFGDLGKSHRVSITVDFKKIGESKKEDIEYKTNVLMREGRELYEKGEYAESILKFNDILKLNPENKEALEWLKKAGNKIDE